MDGRGGEEIWFKYCTIPNCQYAFINQWMVFCFFDQSKYSNLKSILRKARNNNPLVRPSHNSDTPYMDFMGWDIYFCMICNIEAMGRGSKWIYKGICPRRVLNKCMCVHINCDFEDWRYNVPLFIKKHLIWNFGGINKRKIVKIDGIWCMYNILYNIIFLKPLRLKVNLYSKLIIVETISWKIYNQPIIIQTTCNQSHDNGSQWHQHQSFSTATPRTNYVRCYNSNYHAIKQME
jgi:hypothetical protein